MYRHVLARSWITLVILILPGVALFPAPVVEALGLWRPAASLPAPVARPLTLRLASGRVLVVGSSGGEIGPPQRLAVVYDPATDHWSRRATTLAGGGQEAAVLLADGRVLLSGGAEVPTTPSSFHALDTAQVYDPAGDTWTAAASLATARFGHTATRLADGTILVAGGCTGSGEGAPSCLWPVAAAERYDPRTNRWEPAGMMAYPSQNQTATLLPDGRVLVAGGGPGALEQGRLGFRDTAEVYDPATNGWTAAGRLAEPHAGHTATLLGTGQVLVVGGQNGTTGRLATGELYDVAANRWTPAGSLTTGRAGFGAALLADGRVLVAGGSTAQGTFLASAELYDPATNRWAGVPPMTTPRQSPGVVALTDGRVLVLGGVNNGRLLATAELYGPAPAAPRCFPQTGKCLREPFLTYWQTHGGLAINGYPISDEFVAVLEDGQAYQVQYCERVRLEYHAASAPPFDILLGQLGRRLHPDDPPVAPLGTGHYFRETGHNLSGRLLAYWTANGGLPQFGFPISEEFVERLEDGRTYTVQYFERARFELHPENGPPYDVLLGLFGRRVLEGP